MSNRIINDFNEIANLLESVAKRSIKPLHQHNHRVLLNENDMSTRLSVLPTHASKIHGASVDGDKVELEFEGKDGAGYYVRYNTSTDQFEDINISNPGEQNYSKKLSEDEFQQTDVYDAVVDEINNLSANAESAAVKEQIDLSTAKFKVGDVFTAEQIGDDFDVVVIGIEENEEGDGIAYNLQSLGQEGITLDETQIQGEPSHSLF